MAAGHASYLPEPDGFYPSLSDTRFLHRRWAGSVRIGR
jgi:hypothetical protein